MRSSGTVETIDNLLHLIRRDTDEWTFPTKAGKPWFRGQRNAEHTPKPGVFRFSYDEIGLTNMFRNRAPAFDRVPGRTGHTDEWLFLMQHYGAPTRLLDWTESALAGLLFAVYRINKDQNDDANDAAVWMLHPLELNALEDSIGKAEFPNTWSNHPGNIVRNNIDTPFGSGRPSTKYPIAIQTTFSRQMMSSQKSCFTIHGSIENDFEEMFSDSPLVKNGFFRKYLIPSRERQSIEEELDLLGITYSVVFPNLNGLAMELKYRFRK